MTGIRRMTRGDIDNWSDRADIPLLLCDGMDEAILGIGQRFNDHFVVYDQARVLAVLQRAMSEEDAVEFFYYNIVGAWTGPQTPCFLVYDEEGS